VRDFVHVPRCRGGDAAFLRPRDVSGLFNCGTGCARSWNDLAAAVFAAMGRAPQIEYVDMPEAIREKYQYRTQADITHLRQAGFDAEFLSLEDGIADYVGRLERGESP
jgi:ADP-L-glycero-D-manno-heptose 6-epimerase